MSKFTVNKSLVEVEVYYLEIGDEIVVIQNQDTINRMKNKLKKVKARFIRPNYATFVAFMDGIVRNDPVTGEPQIDNIKLKRQKLGFLLKEMEDFNGEKIEVNQELINDMVPELAVALIDAMDRGSDLKRFQDLKSTGVIPEDILKDEENVIKNVWGDEDVSVKEKEKGEEKEKEKQEQEKN
jgi:hypothetical protein